MSSRFPPAALALGALLACAACTPVEWVKRDVTPEQRQQDVISCRQEAWREASARGWYYRPLGPAPFRDAFGRFSYGWPYGYYGDPFGDPYIEESRLAQFCMRAKGYRLEETEPRRKEGG